MVSEKDEAIKRHKAHEEYRKRVLDELNENTLKYRWYVEEVTPAYEGFGYYDQGTPRTAVPVSPTFDNEQDAISWLDDHVPDKGKHLEVVKERLYQQTITTWMRCR